MISTALLALALTAEQPQQTSTAWIPPDRKVACAGVKNARLCSDLLDLNDRDQIVRRKWLANRNDAAVIAEVKKVDAENLERVNLIIKQFGWPGKSLVGLKGSGAAWTVIQHADLDTQKRTIDIMTKAADTGELPWALLATTIDRIAIREGKPQIYGTQFHEANGEMVPDPIEDEAHVDERRAKVGLQPLAEYKKLMDQMYKRPKTAG